MFLLPSRYCQSDRVADFAFKTFGQVKPGWSRVLAISEWVHDHIAFDYGLASPHVHRRRRRSTTATACAATSPTSPWPCAGR